MPGPLSRGLLTWATFSKILTSAIGELRGGGDEEEKAPEMLSKKMEPPVKIK